MATYTPRKWPDLDTAARVPVDGARARVRALINNGFTELPPSWAFARLERYPLQVLFFRAHNQHDMSVLIMGGDRAARRAALDTMKGGQ